MEHYQPVSWIAWAGLDGMAGSTPAAAHAFNVGLHALCALLVYLLARRITTVPAWPAALSALLFALHPLRVEPVAWASAMPYALAAAMALCATLAWIGDRPWITVVLYALSLLARPLALGLPIVLYIVRRPVVTRTRAVLGAMGVAAIAAALAESSARLPA